MASGFTYYGYRYLDTQLGRWLSRDPIGEVGGRNLYQFIKNRTTADLDFLGLDEKSELDDACNALLEKVQKENEEVKRLIDLLDSAKCKLSIRCLCCEGTEMSRRMRGTLGGLYFPGEGRTGPSIIICSDKIEDESDVLRILLHELYHAIQDCPAIPRSLPDMKKGSCSECICNELQAYSTDPDKPANVGPGLNNAQIQLGAVSSCSQVDKEGIKIGPCKDNTRQEMMEMAFRLFNDCAGKKY